MGPCNIEKFFISENTYIEDTSNIYDEPIARWPNELRERENRWKTQK